MRSHVVSFIDDPSACIEQVESDLLTFDGQERFLLTFQFVGVYKYCCQIVPRMSGMVEVVPRACIPFYRGGSCVDTFDHMSARSMCSEKKSLNSQTFVAANTNSNGDKTFHALNDFVRGGRYGFVSMQSNGVLERGQYSQAMTSMANKLEDVEPAEAFRPQQ